MFLFVTLFIVNLIRTIFIIAIIYFGIRILIRFVFPLIISKGMKNMQKNMQNQQQTSKRQEGEVTIEEQPQNHSKTSQNNGEYIDFEEVE